MVAAEAIFNALKEAGEADKTKPLYLNKYPEMLKRSWLWDDLYKGIFIAYTKCHVTYREISNQSETSVLPSSSELFRA